MPLAEAQGRLAKMDANAKQLDLGQRVIARYGCFSCHDIKGFETTQPIGVDLSEEGSKLVTRLDFAFVDIPHAKLDWFHQKLKDPRSFDQGRVLEPLEKLRMPDFHFSEVENERLQTAIMSFQRDVQPAVGAAGADGEARLHRARAARSCGGRTASAAMRSKATAATTGRS